MVEWAMSFSTNQVLRVVRIPGHITQTNQNDFGFLELLSEFVIGIPGTGLCISCSGIG